MSDQNKKDPWSGRNHESPPDLVELISKLFKSSKQAPEGGAPNGGGSADHETRSLGVIALFAIILVAIVWFISGFFIVSPTDQAPVLRFGQYTETLNSGLHWIPRFIKAAYPVNTSTIDKINVSADMLTQDENIVSVEIAVQYRVKDPKAFLFDVVDPIGSLKQVTSSAMRQVIGDNSLDDILTTGRQKVRDNIEQVIKQTLTPYNTGIEITDVNLQPAKPPSAVTAAFDDAINAREDKQKYINQAQAYQNQVISMVKGQQSRIMQDAQAYQAKVVQEAKGNTARYLAFLKPYNASPEVMGDKLYFDTLTNVFHHTHNVINNTNGKSMVYLPVEKSADKTAKSSVGSQTEAAQTLAGAAALPVMPSATSSAPAMPMSPYNNNQRPSYASVGGAS